MVISSKRLPHGLVGATLLAAAAMLTGTGCTDLGVGRPCLAPGQVSAVQISSPALECMSRLCYLEGDEQSPTPKRAVCTARCTTDADCQGAQVDPSAQGIAKGMCGSSFVCGIAVSVGDSASTLACEGICICKDDLRNKDSTTGLACCPTGCEGRCPAALPKC